MLHKEKNKKSIFEDRFKYTIPTQAEMRIVANANEQCFYYLLGIEKCRENVFKQALKKSSDESVDFHECEPVTEAYFRCTTKDLYGEKLEEMEEEIRPYFKNFTNCLFNDFKEIGDCRKYHDDILRHYARQTDNKLDNIYS